MKAGRQKIQSKYDVFLGKDNIEEILGRWKINVAKDVKGELTIMRLSTVLNSDSEVIRNIAKLFGAWNDRRRTIVGYSFVYRDGVTGNETASSHSFNTINDECRNDECRNDGTSSYSFSVDDDMMQLKMIEDGLKGTGKGNVGRALNLSVIDGNNETLDDAVAMVDKENYIKHGN